MPANHKAKSDLIDIFEKYYPKIGIAGLMMGPALFGEDLQQFGHNVGMVVLKQLQQNAAMSNGTVTTIRDVLKVLATHTGDWRAAIHGLVWASVHEASFPDTGSTWDFVRSNAACGAFRDENVYMYTSCVHGFGHGLYQTHISDLDGAIAVCQYPDEDFSMGRGVTGNTTGSAIKPNDRLGEDASQCATGAYMEFSAGVSHFDLTMDICRSSPYPRACWLRYFVVKGPALQSLGPRQDPCAKVSTVSAHSNCVYGMAKALLGRSGKSVREFCDRYSTFPIDDAVMCVYGGMAFQARTLEGNASPEPKASRKKMKEMEQRCLDMYSVDRVATAVPGELYHLTQAEVVEWSTLHQTKVPKTKKNEQ